MHLVMLKRFINKLKKQPSSRKVAPDWRQVTGGPLKGHYLYLDPQATSWQLEMMTGEFDAFIYKALGSPEHFEGAIIWDIGAHIGYHTLCFSSLVGPSGKVICFEPNHFNAERLQQNLDENRDLSRRVTLMTCALSNEDGQAPFVFNDMVDTGESSDRKSVV